MKPVKRLTALLMVLAMLVTNLPLGALAEEATPATETLQESAENSTEPVAALDTGEITEPEAETVAETVEETVEVTVGETVEETVEETVGETVEETVEETVAETVEETVAETVEETVPETTQETVSVLMEEEIVQEDPVLTTANAPKLTWRWLNNDGNGWYENLNNSMNDATGIMAYGNYWCIFYLNLWNESTEEYDVYPVTVNSDSQYLDICHVTEVNNGNEKIRDGEANAAYFTHIMGVNTIEGADAQLSCSYGGENYPFDYPVRPREMGFYSAPEAKLENVLYSTGGAHLDPDSDEFSLYFIELDPENFVYDSFGWDLNTWGQDYGELYCDGEDFITEIDHGNGIIEFKLNTKYVKYVKEHKLSDWKNFCLSVYGDYHMEDGTGNGNFHQELWVSPDFYDDYYLSMAWLDYYDDSWHFSEENVSGNQGWALTMEVCSHMYSIFFLNSYNESTGNWDRIPVIPGENSDYITIAPIKGDENESQPAEGEEYGDYFVRIDSYGTLDGCQYDMTVEHDGRTLRFPAGLYEKQVAFYSENKISPDTIYRDDFFHLSGDEETKSVYLLKSYPGGNPYDVTFRVDDWSGCGEFCDGDLITVTPLANDAGWKIDLNPDYIEYAKKYRNSLWLQFRIIAEGTYKDAYSGESWPFDMGLTVNPPLEGTSFIVGHSLENHGQGWYNPWNAPRTEPGMGTPSDHFMVFYLQVWDEEAQDWIERIPVMPTSKSSRLTFTPITETDEPHIRDDQEDGAYFCRVTATGMDYEVTEISVTHGGETIYAPFFLYERELAFYSANSVSEDTMITNGEFCLRSDASEDSVYLLMKDPGEFQLRNMQWGVDAQGREAEFEQYLTGSELVTMTELDNGGYKFTIDPGYAAAAKANGRYDDMTFNIWVNGEWYDDQGNRFDDYWQDVWVRPPEDSTEPYISASWLENDGEGWYLPENGETQTRYGTRAMDCSWLIFYLNTWNGTAWEKTPIIPYESSDSLTIAKFEDLDGRYGDPTIREGQTLGDYFVNVEAWGSLDESRETIYYDHNGTTLAAPFWVYTRDLSFYDSDEISVESCMPDRQYVIDPDSDEVERVYFRTYDTYGWTIGDVEFEVVSRDYDYHQYTHGEEAVHMEKLGDGSGYEFIINRNFVEYLRKNYKVNWLNLQLIVTGNWYDANGQQRHEFRDECWIGPPHDTDPYICAWELRNNGEGWYINWEGGPTMEYGTRGLDWSWYIFFLNTWNVEKNDYDMEPILPYENSDNLTITRVLDLDEEEQIMDDEKLAEYFVQVRSYNFIDGQHMEKMYFTDDANKTFEMDFTIHPRETGFYSEPVRSLETAIYDNQMKLDSKAQENAAYYLMLVPDGHKVENMEFTLNTRNEDYSAMYCDGEPLVTMTEISGGYKFTINPKYVAAMSTGYDWKNFCIRVKSDLINPEGDAVGHTEEDLWINPPERFDPYISWGYLDEQGEGWFFNPEHMGGLDHYWRFEMSGMNDRWVVFFLNTYDEATKEWTKTPFVPTLTGDDIYMYTLPETGDTIKEGAEYAEYYRHIKACDSLYYYEFTIGCDNVPGYEDLTFPAYVIDRQVAFYSTEEPSVDTIYHTGYTNLSAEGENVFYVSKLHEDAELRNFTWGINTNGEDYTRYCDGEPVVTVEETDLGYKFTVNPKYVQYVTENVHTNWKNLCLYFETDVYALDGAIDVTWFDLLWLEPPEAKVVQDLDQIVQDSKNNEEVTSDQIRDAVQSLDTEQLKDAMENSGAVVDQIKELEDKVNQDTGTNVIVAPQEESPIQSGEIIGAGLNEVKDDTKDITLTIAKPADEKSTEDLDKKYDTSGDTGANFQFSMTLDNVKNTEKLDVPVLVTLAVPDGVDLDLMVLLHYHGDASDGEQVNFTLSKKKGVNYITFALSGFSDFVITHQKVGDVNQDGSITDADVTYVFWHTLFPQVYPLNVKLADVIKDNKITQADAVELLWKSLGF